MTTVRRLRNGRRHDPRGSIDRSSVRVLTLDGRAASGPRVRPAAVMSASSPPRPRVVAAIVVYNTAELLEKAVRRIPRHLVDAIFVMDDASTDGTYEVARRLGLPVFRNERNLGYGGNVRAALWRAVEQFEADYVVEVHGDGAQFNPAAIADALPLMRERIPLILGSRFIQRGQARRDGMSLVRLAANRGFSWLARMGLGLPLTEFHTGFRIYSREFIQTLPLAQNASNHLFSFQILAQAAYFGQVVREIPVECDYRSAHTSIPLWDATLYSFAVLACIAQFRLARAGWRHNGIFPVRPAEA